MLYSLSHESVTYSILKHLGAVDWKKCMMVNDYSITFPFTNRKNYRLCIKRLAV